jgi:ABC-type transport system substrate-binding protein
MSSQPGGDTPQRTLRKFHSDQQETYAHMGLFDKAIDALIEKSEATIDPDENIKLVKQIQIEVLKKYGGFYLVLTQQATNLRSSKIQDWEINPVASPQFETQAWVKPA